MSSSLQIIKDALTSRPDALAVVTAVDGLTVTVATRTGRLDAVSTVKLSIGDKVTLVNGVATLVRKASVIEPV